MLLGTIPTDLAPVGLAFSPNGRWLYATSELAGGPQGSLSVINVRRAERHPATAVVDAVSAGCQPVRVAVAPNGQSVWVTARGSNEVEAFSASALRDAPRRSLIATVRVGQSPVGLSFVNDGRELVTGDSDRFDTPGAHSALSVINTTSTKRPRLIGDLSAAAFPRDMALAPDGTLWIADYAGKTVQALTTASIDGQ